MNIQLPLCNKPPIVSNQFYALPFSAILCDDKYKDWFYTEFTQWYAFPPPDGGISIYLYHPLSSIHYDPLDCINMDSYKLKLGTSVIDLFTTFLSNGYYVYTFCDDYYIECMNISYHRLHDLLICGFDSDAKRFLIRAYINGNLSDFEASFQEISGAMNSEHVTHFSEEKIVFFKRGEEDIPFSSTKVAWHLIDYLDGIDTMNREHFPIEMPPYTVHGIDVYDLLAEYYQQYDCDKSFMLINNIYCFYEHKQHLWDKFRYMRDRHKFNYDHNMDAQMEEVVSQARVILNLMLKIEQRRKMQLSVSLDADRMIQRLTTLKEQEFHTLQEILDRMLSPSGFRE